LETISKKSSFNKTLNSFKPKSWFTLEEDNKIYGDRLPADIYKKIDLLGKGGFAVVFKVLYNGTEMALKQTSKINNYKSSSDISSAKNELKIQEHILNSYEKLHNDKHKPIISIGYNNICKMIYNSADNKDIWIG